MAINERLIHTAAAAEAGNAGEEGLILHLDANDVDSYDGDGSVWYDIKDHEYTPATNVDEHFNTVTYTGASAPHVIDTVGFQPDLIWIKNRDTTDSHAIVDSVRGITSPAPYLASDQSAAQATSTNMPTSVQPEGFTITGNGGRTNTIGEDYVAWCFKAGGAAVSNTNGDITSQVSVNNDLGFSIVSYTGNSSFGQTVGHGLDVQPQMVIHKNLSNARNWRTYVEPLGATKYINLDETAAAGTYGSFNNTAPTPTVFSTTSSVADRATNFNGDNYIAYCFTSKRGVSKVGSYTGTGGNMTVNVGFEPAFVMIKNTSAAASWHIFDNKRTAANPSTGALFPNETLQELDYNGTFEFTSTGFNNKVASGSLNTSGSSYIYYAVAKNTKETSLIPDTDLELHLDAGDDTTVSTSTWTDLTTNSYDGTFTNFSSTLIDFYEKELGNFITFDGTNDYVKINNTGLTKNSGTDFAVEVWARMHTTGTADYIVSQTTDDGNTQNWLLRFHSDNKIKFFVYGTDEYLSTSSTYSANVWYHIVGLVESNGIVRIYVNGTLEVSSSSGKSADTNAYNTFIGSLGGSSTGRLDGDIGQVRIYHTALTQDQIRQNYNFTKNNYPNGNDGTISGATFLPSAVSFDFDGNNDYVSLDSSFRNAFDQPYRSLSMWLKWDGKSIAFGMPFWMTGAGLTNGRFALQLNHSNGQLDFIVGGAGSYPLATLTANTWTHIAVVQSGNSYEAFVNDTSVGTATNDNYTDTASSATSYIGSYQGTNHYWSGEISDVKFYSRALTDAEVTAEYSKGYNGIG